MHVYVCCCFMHTLYIVLPPPDSGKKRDRKGAKQPANRNYHITGSFSSPIKVLNYDTAVCHRVICLHGLQSRQREKQVTEHQQYIQSTYTSTDSRKAVYKDTLGTAAFAVCFAIPVFRRVSPSSSY